MKNNLKNTTYRHILLLIMTTISISSFYSCVDDYFYDDKEPEWLGSNIYDYLNNDGNFKNFVGLINDLGYQEIFKQTGSNTLFVANDSSFNEFYKNNPWGVSSYQELTTSQKKMLLKFSMLNNAYLIETLSNYLYGGILNEGMAMRTETELAALDTIPFLKGEQLPDGPFWENYKQKGIYLMQDNTNIPLVFFTQKFLTKFQFTDEDFSVLAYGQTRKKDDAHIFNIKINRRDIVCKNGYINIIDKVLVPPVSMAQYIDNHASTSLFSKLINRFSAPYFDAEQTLLYRQLHPEFTDSIFTKHFFSSAGPNAFSSNSTSGTRVYPDNKTTSPYLLTYDPGWNSYKNGALEADMAAMFVPSNDAMTNFIHSDLGKLLSPSGSWDDVPNDIVMPLIGRTMRTSLIESIPSKFHRMVDSENKSIAVSKNDIIDSYTAVNGEVYVTNKVYPPVDYISVWGPVLFSDQTKIMKWAIKCYDISSSGKNFEFYRLYLNSLESNYSLFVPTDQFFETYVDPIAYVQDVQGMLKFWWDEKNNTVNATVYKYNKTTGVRGDSVGVVMGNANATISNLVRNRLWSILDSHIVVRNNNSELSEGYHVTKANDIIKVTGSGSNCKIQGGNDLDKNVFSNTTGFFNQYINSGNGYTYFIDKPIDPAIKSIYKVLSETPQFSEFFNLLNGAPTDSIFTQQGVDYRIRFFNAFRYTVYVPTNEKIAEALQQNTISTWAQIYAMPTTTEAQRKAQIAAVHKLIRFLKYHFQDDAVFLGNTYSSANKQFQSATLKEDNVTTYYRTSRNKFLKIGVDGDANNLTLTVDSNDGTKRQASVVKTDGLYNLVVKDYIFGNYATGSVTTMYKNVDGTGATSGSAFSTSTITNTASAVIHQIDNILKFE